ncbi:ABC transporter ATP-binding protein [Pontibacter beigongshangensis]|uniref:ABC transporter ATP-binding protein n=1 Tax=Pontibacter beigongshangensis TaxID=2574733 RepID=UPI0016505B32|nr:ABC transporter ATP-binding protein [Pontibacter beigongshangensis]
MGTAIKVENLSKQYRLGEVGTGTISHDLNRWWHKIRGKEDPYLKLGEVNDRATKGTSDYVWALRDINFEVQQGEVLGIIGKNGAGKSTLLKLLSRVASPTIGTIKAKGRIASLLEVGTGFNNELTGRENVFLNGAILGMTKAEIKSKFDEIVAFSGTERYIDTPVKRYSSGMRVRLAFAVAAHLESEILIVDEVLAVGDAEFQNKAIGKMQDVASGEGRTVLFVSHNMASVAALCNRGLLLANGTVNALGEIHDIIGKYLIINNKDIATKYTFQNDGIVRDVWINSAHIESNEVSNNNVISGSEIKIIVQYIALHTNLKCSLHIGIYDNYGDKLVHLGSVYSGFDTFRTEKNGIIECVIPKFPLVEGKYTINISLHLNGRPYHKIKDALSLIVENGDFFGSGKLPNPKESKILVNHNWNLS